jgi:hypothetical protein
MKLRFTIRDLFWLVLVAALATGWYMQSQRQAAAFHADLAKRDQILHEIPLKLKWYSTHPNEPFPETHS